MDKNLLSKIIVGKANSEEKEVFFSHLKEDKKDEELYYEVKSLWIRTSMQKTDLDMDAEFENLWSEINHQQKKANYKFRKRLLQYAAIAVVILNIGGIAGYFLSKNAFEVSDTGIQKFTAMKGSVSIIELADGTKVWLNSGTRLIYHEDLKSKQRLAELTGEAYFEVKHRDDFPLLVKVNDIVVRDLGTTFNIKAYPEDEWVETSLVEGKAEILSSTGNVILDLKPGESAVYSTTERKIEVRTISKNVLSAWRDGKFVIRDQRLEDIFKEISRWYDIEYDIKNQKLKDFRYTGNIKKSTTALHVIKMLQSTTNFNYQIIEKTDQPDKIIIY
tara:strand:- start:91107 stop:92099 length:993 start_codon:yes stop_codon:yes gene_type:complete